MLERIAGNLSRGIYGNRAEVNAKTLAFLTEGERLAFYSRADVRETLADMPEDETAERLADAENELLASVRAARLA